MEYAYIEKVFESNAEEENVIRHQEAVGVGHWRKLACGAVMLLFALLAVRSACAMGEDESGPHRLVNVPVPEVMPHLGALLTVEGRFFTGEPDESIVPEEDLLAWGPNIRLGMGILNRAEVGVEASSAFDSLDQFTGYIKVFVLKEGKNWPAIGIGAFDLSTEEDTTIDAGYPVTTVGPHYLEDHETNNSAYIVFAKHIPEIESIPLKLRLYLGIGRGRFIDRCGAGEDLQGAFLGGELKHRLLRFVGEIAGTSASAGLGTCMPVYEGKGYRVAVNGMLQGKYLQHIRSGRSDIGLYPAIGARLGVCVVPICD